jgi:GTPase SAR1 family protein
MIRIILTGPHSCGKTTLANELIRRWEELFPESKPSLLSEVARNVMRTRGFTRADISSVSMPSTVLRAPKLM